MMEIYLDNAATTKPSESAMEAYINATNECYGNASALHGLGLKAEKCIKQARGYVAKSLSVTPEEIIFTSGGTESDNLALIGVANSLKHKGKHIITTKMEHHAILHTCAYLESIGFSVTYLDSLPDGTFDTEQLKESVRPDTILISVMAVNNETGAVQPINKIKEIAPDAIIHSDCIQAYGKIPLNPKKLNVDMMSFSGHKIHAVKGVGVLYVKKGVKISPISFGGDQEGIRSGTLNTAGVAAFGEEAKNIAENIDGINAKLKELHDYFVSEILKIPDTYINGGKDSVHIINAGFDGVRGEVLLHALETKGIYVSTGSACTSKSTKTSHVLDAMGVKQSIAQGSVRISISV
ncbi:MAG: cysteine desulfurase, partial [Clostridia bacterium]|nr:cysteine desulfurase [Clostridia bacterium]